MEEPDPQIVADAAGGDLGAFEKLVRRYQPDMWRLALHLVGDESVADDVCQETFVRAYRFLPGYRGRSKFSTWLFSIARHCALDELRRTGRRTRLTHKMGRQPPPASAEVGSNIEVRDALARLPLELREPVVLIDMYGVSYRDVAGMLKIPEGTVKSRIHHARELLVAALNVEEDTGEG